MATRTKKTSTGPKKRRATKTKTTRKKTDSSGSTRKELKSYKKTAMARNRADKKAGEGRTRSEKKALAKSHKFKSNGSTRTTTKVGGRKVKRKTTKKK